MTQRRRLWLLLLLGGAIVALVALAAGLPQTQLLPGRPFHLGAPPTATPTPETSTDTLSYYKALQVLFTLLIWVGTPLLLASIVWAILRKKREYLLTVLLALAWAALIVYLQVNVATYPGSLWNNSAETTPEEVESAEPTDVFQPNAPDWLVYAASAGLAALLLVAARATWQALRQRRQPLELLAKEAQRAVEEIGAGADWRDAVRKCYAEMCRALQKGHGLARQASMTPSEFVVHLEEAGLPVEHIARLTRLFETVRYGGRSAGEKEEAEAIACLKAVAELCRGQP